MPRNRRYCPHCRETVSSNTYLKHRKLYFDASSNSWAMKNVLAAASSDESDLENEQCLNASIYDSDEAEGKKMLLSIIVSASVYTTQIAPHYACNCRCESLTDCLNTTQ